LRKTLELAAAEKNETVGLARDLGISRQMLGYLKRGQKGFSDTILRRICRLKAEGEPGGLVSNRPLEDVVSA